MVSRKFDRILMKFPQSHFEENQDSCGFHRFATSYFNLDTKYRMPERSLYVWKSTDPQYILLDHKCEWLCTVSGSDKTMTMLSKRGWCGVGVEVYQVDGIIQKDTKLCLKVQCLLGSTAMYPSAVLFEIRALNK